MTQPAPADIIPAIRAPKRLNTLGQVRREMTAVYQDMREGVIQTQDGSRLVYALGQIAGVIETEQIERRLESIEKQVKP